MSNNLQIKIFLSAFDKASQPFLKAVQSSRKLTQAINANEKEFKRLEKAIDAQKQKNNGMSSTQAVLERNAKRTTEAISNQRKELERLNKTQLKQHQATLQKMDKRAESFKTQGREFLGAGAAMGLTGYKLLNPALQFEKDFSKVGALTGLDKTEAKQAEQLERLRQQAIQLGASTSFTSGDVAQGQGYLAMAGFNPEQIEKSMGALLSMTKASGGELGQVADIASDISSGFKISADEMGRVSDVLTMTFTKSNTTLEGLGESMKYVGPLATEAGQSFESMAAMVGKLGDVGIKGTQAGTSLRSAMIRLAREPKQTEKALRKLGITAKDAKGNFKQLPEILTEIYKKTQKLGSKQRLELLSNIFGAEAATAMAELVKQAGTGELQKLTKTLEQSAGRAEKVAQEMSDNFLGDIDSMNSAKDAISISIFQEVAPFLRESAQAFTEFLRKVNDWIKENPKLVASFIKWGSVATAIALAIGGLSLIMGYIISPILKFGYALVYAFSPFGLVSKAISIICTGLKILSIAFLKAGMAMLASPITWVIAALALIGYAAYKLWQNWDTVWSWIKEKCKAFTDWLSGIFSPIFGSISSAATSFGNALSSALDFAMIPLNKMKDGLDWVLEKLGLVEEKNSNLNANPVASQGLATTANLAQGLLNQHGFSSGGYTGNGGKNQVAGIVHRGEYVLTKEATARLGVPFLNRLNYGGLNQAAILTAGLGASVAMATPVALDDHKPFSNYVPGGAINQPMNINITINSQPNQDPQAIAREVARQISYIQQQTAVQRRSRLIDSE